MSRTTERSPGFGSWVSVIRQETVQPLLLSLLLILFTLLLGGCAGNSAASVRPAETTERLPLHYAEHFCADRFENGSYLLTLGGQEQWLLLPDGAEAPAGTETLRQLRIPVRQICLASSSAADFFLRLDALDRVAYTATAAESWKLPEMREALAAGKLCYAGRYNAPDYELLLTEGCGLVVENTMILHAPETKEKLESLGLPVMIEYSSYESEPLGRVEWIKLYGLLTGKLSEAERFFEEQEAIVAALDTGEDRKGKSAAFFHLSAGGGVVVRRRADYVTRMIELAGGETAITELPKQENALSTVTIQLESFYTQARDADVLIYNSTTAGDPQTLEGLLELCPPLRDFKAVHSGEVWCTEQSMFQQSTAAAGMIADFRSVLSGDADEKALRYLHRLV